MNNIKNTITTITTTITNLRDRVIRGIINVLIPDPRTLIESIKAHAVCNLADLINTDEVVRDLADEVSRDITEDDVIRHVVENNIDMAHIERKVTMRIVDSIDNNIIIETVVETVEREMSDPSEIEDRVIDRLVDDVSIDEYEVINRILCDLDIDAKINTILRDKVAETLRLIAVEVA
jgi:hypothetical protein